MMSIDEFLKDYEPNLRMSLRRVQSNPNMMDNMGIGAKHYSVTFYKEDDNSEFSTYYSVGPAWKEDPDISCILDCLASDASSVEGHYEFENWAIEFGYDTDSRRAEKVYRLVCEGADELRDFLGAESYDVLLWNTERM